MKKTTRVIALLLSLVLLFSAVGGMTAVAATASYKVYTMKADTYYKTDNYRTEVKKVYKLAIEKDSIVKITWSGSPSSIYILITKDAKAEKRVKSYYVDKKSGTETLALAKGTYYFNAEVSSSDVVGKYKVNVTAIKDPGNYCIAKAAALKAKTKITLTQTDNYDYNKWYKITLSSKKKISVETNGYGYYIDIYNSKYERLKVSTGSNLTVTEKAQAKGTYYIRVSGYSLYATDYGPGQYITMKWY